MMIEAEPVPLDERELRHVEAAGLPGAERGTELIDVTRARGEEPFHRKLR